jgi:hypothetical protein
MSPSKEKDKVEFRSHDQGARIVVEPKRTRMNPDSGEMSYTEGKTIEFAAGPGGVGVFFADADEAAFLRDYDGPVSVAEVEEFVAAPNAESTLEAIVEAAVDGDADTVTDIYLAERSGDSRPEVLKAAAKALEKLDADEPPPPATPIHEVQRHRDSSVSGGPDAVAPYGKDPAEVQAEAEAADAKAAKAKKK